MCWDAGVTAPARVPARRFYAGLLVLSLLVQLWVLYDPAPGDPVLTFPLADKLVHAAIFAIPVVLAARAGLPWRLVLVALAVHAPLSEAIQASVFPERSGTWADVLADLAGLGVAIALVGSGSSPVAPARPRMPRGDDAA